MFLSFALCCLLQNPTFHWDQEVDKSYWQALHLLEVDNNPVAAIELLEGLVDETSVIQYRGQASIIMAQTYRAQLRAGQKQSAATLLPFIRRESLGTEFYTQAEAIIADAQAYQNPEGDLDPDFLQVVVNQLVLPQAKGRDVSTLAKAYGARLSPYLKEIVQRENQSNQVAGALAWSVVSANSEVLDFFISNLEDFSGEILFENMPKVTSLSPVSRSCYSNFLVKLSRQKNVMQAQSSIAPLMALAISDEPAFLRLKEILADSESLLAPFIQKGFEGRGDYSAQLLVDAIMMATPPIADELRRSIRGLQSIKVLTMLIDAGDEDSIQLLPLYLLPDRGNKRGHSDINFNYFEGTCLDNWGGEPFWGGETWNSRCPSVSAEEYFSDLKPYAALLLHGNSSDLKKLGLMVAIQFQDWELALEYLEEMPAPANLATLLYTFSHPRKVPPAFLPYLLDVVDDSPLGKFTRSILLRNSQALSAEFLIDAFDPELGRDIINYLDRQPGNEETADLLVALLDATPPKEVTQRILQNFPRKGLDQLGGAMHFITNHRTQLENLSSLARDYQQYIGDYVKLRLDKGLPIDAEEAKVIAEFIHHSLWEDWIDYSIRSSASSYLSADLERLIVNGDGADSILLHFLKDRESARRLLTDLERVVSKSTVLMNGIIERYPDLIHSENYSRFWKNGKGGGYALLNHPDPAIVRNVLKICLGTAPANPDLMPLENCVLRSLDHPGTAGVAALVAVRRNFKIELASRFKSIWEMEDLVDRKYLMSAIGSIYDQRLMPIILEGIRYPESEVLISAENALARYSRIRESEEALLAWQRAGKEGSPIDALIMKLESGKLEVRIAAIDSLGTMGAAEALPFLVELLEDENERIAKAAAAAVKKINSQSGGSEEG